MARQARKMSMSYDEWRITYRRKERAIRFLGADGSLNCPSCLEESYPQRWPSGQYLPQFERECANKHRCRGIRLTGIDFVRRISRKFPRQRVWRGTWDRILCPMCAEPILRSNGRYVAFDCAHISVRHTIRLMGTRLFRLSTYEDNPLAGL